MIQVIDNYDSFTFNLVDMLRVAGFEVQVDRNDALSVEEVLGRGPRALVISPGPGRPEDSGICPELVRRAGGHLPVLGVCLGHQVLGMVFGAKVVSACRIVHGKTSMVCHTSLGCFAGLPERFQVMRYHSLVLERSSLPEAIEVTAWVEEEPMTVMGIRHRIWPLEGIQFHPESFLTPCGSLLVGTWLRRHLVGQA